MSPPPDGTGGRRSHTAGGADLNELYEAHSTRFVAQLYAYTRDLALAEDLVQEAFVRLVSRWSRISKYDDPVAWVRRVAWNLATSDWRRNRRAQRLSVRLREEPVPEPSPDRVVLVRALATLPPVQRRVVVMFYLADMSLADIAELEQVSENTIKQRLHRGRTALAAALKEPRSEVGHA
ncbi:MAG: SigE family RNA polymerase sigma factor [Micromonosporaceae bacterium]|nr:SigE family RNA polymerase sigma factor [Micromonosporaceae bacterium]